MTGPGGGSGAVERWLEAARSAPERTGVFVDFDGTLAPIVDDPAAARPWPDAPQLLARLADRLACVVVVSGRPVDYLVEHLGSVGHVGYLGLYGLERILADGSGTESVAGTERWRTVVAEVSAEAERDVPAGVVVERKGLTVTLHYRSNPARAGWVESFAAALGGRTGLVAHGGKMSVELRPPIDVDKGTVVAELGAGLDVVLFAGDDRGDLPAFAALDRMRAAGVNTLKVVSGGEETPDEVAAAADVTVDGPAGVARLLGRLLPD